ncbi:MAG: single-stranded DNA-binding protein, partial [Flavobacteriales bacterium]
VVMWRSLAEVAEKYLKKGNQVYVEGKIKSRSYTDRDGNTRYITEVVAENFVMLTRNESNRSSSTESGTDTNTANDKEMGDLPF